MSDDSNPLRWLTNRILSLGPSIREQQSRPNALQVVFTGGNSDDSAFRISIIFAPSPLDITSIEDILDRSLQESRQRTNPASTSAIEKLAKIKLKSTNRFPDPCPVCREHFNVNETIIKLPCLHSFHENCIIPWFNSHNSCPLCRYELPVDDLEEERERKERMLQRDEEIAKQPKVCELLDFSECLKCNDDDDSSTTNNNNSLKSLHNCNHLFHPECVEKYAKDKEQEINNTLACPICNVISPLPSICPTPVVSSIQRPPHKKRKRSEIISLLDDSDTENDNDNELPPPLKKQKTSHTL